MKLELSEKLLVKNLFASSSKVSLDNVILKDLIRLTGDASTRRYYRIFTNGISYVACLDNPVVNEKYDFLEVHKLLEKNKIRVPKIYDKKLKSGYLLEEDLGDITLLKHLANISDKEGEFFNFKKVVDILIKIHSIDVCESDDSNFIKNQFDFEKLFQEISFTQKYFIGEYFGKDFSKQQQVIYDEAFGDICTKLGKAKKVITHRDFHSRNIMYKGSELIVIDFQDARQGIPQYDLASLLDDCYYKLDRSNKFKLKEYYWDNFLEKKQMQSKDEFENYYKLMVIQRVFKAIGSFSYIYKTRGDDRYLKYIGFAFEKIREVLLEYPEYKDLRILLTKIYYEY